MAIELKVPEVGESIREVQIGKWLKEPGDFVKRDEDVVEIETDKASVEIPAPAQGVITEILRKTGEIVAVGDVVGYMEEKSKADPAESAHRAKSESKRKPESESEPAREDRAGGKSAAKPEKDKDKDKDKGRAKGKGKTKKGGGKSPSQPATATRSGKSEAGDPERTASSAGSSDEATGKEPSPRVMPAARRLLAEHGLSAEDVSASGPGGRLLKEDVQRHLENLSEETSSPSGREGNGEAERPKSAAREQPVSQEVGTRTPAVTGAASGKEMEEIVPMSLIRRRIAERLVEAQQQAALLTTFNEIDMSAVMELRRSYQEAFTKKYDIKLGFMSFFVKGMIDALKQYPELNAEIRENNIVYRNYYHLGIAIGGGKGLVVPVIRHAEWMSFAEIELTIADFGRRARDNKIKPEELMGGTFTISNGGIYGSLLSTPIVNPPQSGVLGMHTIQERPVARDGQVVIRPMMYVAMTYDHRIVDGQGAVSCLKRLKDVLEEPARLLIEV